MSDSRDSTEPAQNERPDDEDIVEEEVMNQKIIKRAFFGDNQTTLIEKSVK